MRRAHRRLEKHKPSFADAIQGWHLFRKANLIEEQKQLITLRAPRLEKEKIIASFTSFWDTISKSVVINLINLMDERDSMEIVPTSSEAMWPRMTTSLSMSTLQQNGLQSMTMVHTVDGMTLSRTPLTVSGLLKRLLTLRLPASRPSTTMVPGRLLKPMMPPTYHTWMPGKGRAQACLHCLRCGQPGRFAANCPVPAKTGTKRPATEPVAQLEDAHVTFLDFKGHERYDVAMLNPGASAFLSGYGPARRYLRHLAAQGYPINEVQFHRCRHKFHLGGDGECWSHWVMQLPMCIAGRYGQTQVFLLKGETPLLLDVLLLNYWKPEELRRLYRIALLMVELTKQFKEACPVQKAARTYVTNIPARHEAFKEKRAKRFEWTTQDFLALFRRLPTFQDSTAACNDLVVVQAFVEKDFIVSFVLPKLLRCFG
eukprot:s1694_g9.t1